jgi:hypothetical protein
MRARDDGGEEMAEAMSLSLCLLTLPGRAASVRSILASCWRKAGDVSTHKHVMVGKAPGHGGMGYLPSSARRRGRRTHGKT